MSEILPEQILGEGEVPSVEFVRTACENALAGKDVTAEELFSLLEIEPDSEQAKILWKTNVELARRGNKGFGYIYGQIGIDSNSCPGNCHYCNFALCNRPNQQKCEAKLEDILHTAKLFAENGVHLISLMSSAAYSFDKYLSLVADVRAAIGPDVAIMANTRDLSADDARALKDAGANNIYHAVRLGEGRITGLSEEKRWKTIENAYAAGLGVASSVEPVYKSQPKGSLYYQTKNEIIERMFQLEKLTLVCTGVAGLHAVAGTKMENVETFSRAKIMVISNVFQLLLKGKTEHGGARSIYWVDAGLDPRSRGYGIDDAHHIARIEEIKETLSNSGWKLAPADAMAY